MQSEQEVKTVERRPRLCTRKLYKNKHLGHLIACCLLTLVTSSCFTESPPSPPDDLEALLGYLFEHAADEDPTLLASGIEELHAWFQDPEKLDGAREGFQISELSPEALESTGLIMSGDSLPSLEGVSVVTKSPHCVRSIVGLLTWEDFGSLLTSFESYERTFNQESACMVDRRCEQVTAESESRSNWVNLIGITTRYHIEFRWVYTEVGWALVHRFWLKEPAIGNQFNVKMNSNFYVGITLPDSARSVTPPSPSFIASGNGLFGSGGDRVDDLRETLQQPGSLRIHANWFAVDTGDIPLTKPQIANILVQQQKNDSEAHDRMINENETPGQCLMDAEENDM